MTPHPSRRGQRPRGRAAKLQAWLAAWDRAAAELDRPSVVFYTYLLDEPNDKEAYQYVQKWGRAVRRSSRPSRSWWSSRRRRKTRRGAISTARSTSGARCSACTTSRPPQSAGPWARRSGPTRPSARGTEEPVVADRFSAPQLPRADLDRLALPDGRTAVLGRAVVLGPRRRPVDRSQDLQPPQAAGGRADLQRRGEPGLSRLRGRLRRDRPQPAPEGPARLDRGLRVPGDARAPGPGRRCGEDRPAAGRFVLPLGTEARGLRRSPGETGRADPFRTPSESARHAKTDGSISFARRRTACQ